MLDRARLVPKGHSRPGLHVRTILTCSTGAVVRIEIRLDHGGGVLNISCSGRHQCFALSAHERHFGGLQDRVICPTTWKRVRVPYKPGEASFFASRHAWGRRAAYLSQFPDPVGRAWRTKETVKQRLIGDEGPDAWDLPPKPKGTMWSTFERWEATWEAKYDKADGALDLHLRWAAGRLMRVMQPRDFKS